MKPRILEQWDAAKPSIDRTILCHCFLLGLADPARSVARVLLRWTSRRDCNAQRVRLPSIVSSIEWLFRFNAQWVNNPHPLPFSQAWEKGAEGGLRVDLRFDASNLLHDGSLSPIVSKQVDCCVVTHHRILSLPLCCSTKSVLVQ